MLSYVAGTLQPPASFLRDLIEAHGGTFVSSDIGDGSVITHLIASDGEVRKAAGKKTVKYTTALNAGVPIVSPQYVLALADALEPADNPADEGDAGDGNPADEGDGGEVEDGGAFVEPPAAKRSKAATSAASNPDGKGGGSAAEAIELSDDDDGDGDDELEEDFSKYTVAELKDKCTARGLSVSGRKAALVARLQEGGTAGTKRKGGADNGAPAKKPPKAAKGGAGSSAGGAGSSAGGGVVVGPKLRQRKYMVEYLLDGELGSKLPSVASVLVVEQARAAYQKSKQPLARAMLPQIEIPSPLVSVNPDSGLGPGWAVYVDEYNLACVDPPPLLSDAGCLPNPYACVCPPRPTSSYPCHVACRVCT